MTVSIPEAQKFFLDEYDSTSKTAVKPVESVKEIYPNMPSGKKPFSVITHLPHMDSSTYTCRHGDYVSSMVRTLLHIKTLYSRWDIAYCNTYSDHFL